MKKMVFAFLLVLILAACAQVIKPGKAHPAQSTPHTADAAIQISVFLMIPLLILFVVVGICYLYFAWRMIRILHKCSIPGRSSGSRFSEDGWERKVKPESQPSFFDQQWRVDQADQHAFLDVAGAGHDDTGLLSLDFLLKGCMGG